MAAVLTDVVVDVVVDVSILFSMKFDVYHLKHFGSQRVIIISFNHI